MSKKEIKLICTNCDYEVIRDDDIPPMNFKHSEWSGTIVCPCCNGNMMVSESWEPGKHQTEMDKVLDLFEPGVPHS